MVQVKKQNNNKRLYVEQMKQTNNRFVGPRLIYLIIYILGTGSDSKKINFYIKFLNSGIPVKIEEQFITKIQYDELFLTGFFKGVQAREFGSAILFFKGTVSRDFRLLVFFMNQFPPSP
jgi:hypothetical protein